MKGRLLHADVIAGVLAVVVALVFLNAAGRLPSFEVKLAGPEFFPRVSAGLLIVLALLLVASALRRSRTSQAAEKNRGDGDEDIKAVFKVTVVSVAFYYAMHFFGFLVAAFLYCMLLTALTQKKKNLKAAAANAVAVVGVVYVVFSYLLRASLPAGVLFR